MAATTIEIASGSVVSAASGTAVVTSFGSDTIRNSGTIIGDIDLGTGLNNFPNLAGGTYISSAGLNGALIIGSAYTDEGEVAFERGSTLNISGTDNIGMLTVKTGTSAQIPSVVFLGGTLPVDVESGAAGQKSDRLQVEGVLFTDPYGVQIKPHVINSLKPADSFTIVGASRIVIGGLKPYVDAGAGPIKWDVQRTIESMTPAHLVLTAKSADFVGTAQRALTPTEAAIANSLQKEWNSGQADMGRTFAALANATPASDFS